MTHYSRSHVVFEKLKSRHGSIFDENYDEIQKNLQSFDFVSAKREWRLKRHWPLEGYTFILAPRELTITDSIVKKAFKNGQDEFSSNMACGTLQNS